MSTYMNGQGAALDETFVAITPGANIGTVVGVDAVVSDEVGLAIELLSICHGGQYMQTDDRVMSRGEGQQGTFGQAGQEHGNSLVCCRPAMELRRSAAMAGKESWGRNNEIGEADCPSRSALDSR